ncbi:hypothetical protein EYF80_015926 [Liparis tanakae]|uniref:Uncharacterized protein n=1 Tax=Liparis tanakae TaxID=230148 RepID=A0A4Z2I777_9TELE|nr:hypothetical protein EYF80_015926 [Liparis tanakae]
MSNIQCSNNNNNNNNNNSNREKVCRYQKGCDPQHQVSDVIGVGEIARRHHLTDPNWNVQASQDPGEDLRTYSEESRLDHETPKKYINANDSLWGCWLILH